MFTFDFTINPNDVACDAESARGVKTVSYALGLLLVL